MKTPLVPEIKVAETPGNMGVCNCCGREADDHRIKHVKFGWRDRSAPHGGGTAVALCPDCRRKTAIALIESL